MTRLSILALLLLSLVPATTFAQADEPERLRIHGSNLLGDRLVPALVTAWLKDIGYGGIARRRVGADRLEIHAVREGEPLVVEINKRGTAAGLAALANGEAEIAMTARQPNASEVDAAWQLGDLTAPEQEWVLGLDGLVVLVAPGNPVAELSIEQLRGVLSGKIRDWRELGGTPGPVHVHTMMKGSGTAELSSNLVLRGASQARDTRTYSSSAKVVAATQADSRGIALVGLRAPRGSLKLVAIRGGALAVLPDRAQVSSEDYPLQRRIYFHTGQLITALGRGFAQYAVSPRGQSVVERSPFMSLSLQPMAPGNLQRAPEEYRELVGSARRLPMTVRFGSSAHDLLDSRSRQDVDRLANYLQRPENIGRRVLLLGFANPEPRSPYRSLSLSQERVDYVSSELLALKLKVVSVRGFGGSRSLIGADHPGARYRNNRVEVWIR